MIGSLIGGLVGAYSQNKAAKESAKISREALALQQQQQQKSWDSVQPYMTAGAGALGAMSEGDYQRSSAFDNRLKTGLDAVTTSKAVNGLLRSGGALKAVTGYASDLAADDYNNWFGQQQSIANMGLQGAGIGAGVSNQMSANIGTNASNQANARMVGANAWSSLAGQLGGAADRMSSYG